ncbi:helix-turn-helix transcriptional regulator [Frigidibacter sp. ROC022]|uniref:helix-turn-helix transcriptional regulator n=1 Tax=Frigidibacter sp. ROC022 TaxID=2971796 RepID=UPI00215A6A28|nr:hypothetical protein [Frigidibacter sp. ROC022]MCR8726743.1 hypothetical protein [Frigidibacter sp. ROC022]
MERRLSDLLVHAYGSVLSERRWPNLLDHLVSFFDARAAVLVIQEHATDFEGFDAASAVYRDDPTNTYSYYLENLAHHEAPAWSKLTEKGPAEVYFDTELGPAAEALDAQDHYRFARVHFGIRRRIAFRLNDTRGWFDAIALAYGSNQRSVPSSVVPLVRSVSPHLARALELTRTFSMLRTRYNAVVAALDRFGIGVAIALPSGQVLVSNAEANRIFEESGVIRLGAQLQVACRDPEMDSRLRASIERNAATAAGESQLLDSPIRLERGGSTNDILIDVAPVKDATSEIERDLSGALVFLIDTARPPPLDQARFASLYGLTSAEAEVLSELICGRTTPEIAEIRSTSVNTARNQVQAVLGKTCCKTRGQVLQLMVKTMPPITGS